MRLQQANRTSYQATRGPFATAELASKMAKANPNGRITRCILQFDPFFFFYTKENAFLLIIYAAVVRHACAEPDSMHGA